MAKLQLRRFITVPVLYLLIIFVICVLQFTQGTTFSIINGPLSISGSYITDEDENRIPALPFHMVFKGLDMYIDDSSPVTLSNKNGEEENLSLLSIEDNETGISLGFSENVSLDISVEKRGDVDLLSISAKLPTSDSTLKFPYKTIKSAKEEISENSHLISTNDKQYIFQGLVDSDAKNLIFNNRATTLVYRTFIPSRGVVITDLGKNPLSSENLYNTNIDKFAATTLSALRNSLNSSYTEDDIAAFIAEMARNGMYNNGISSVPQAFISGTTRTYKTNTFLNNLVRTNESMILQEREDLSRISRLVSEKNPSVFEFPALIPFLWDRTSTPLLNDILTFIPSLNMESVTPLQAAGILAAGMDYDTYLKAEKNPFLILEESCLRIIRESLNDLGENIFVSTDGKNIGILENIKTGKILIKYGKTYNKPEWANAGRIIISSVLSFMNDKGNFPETASFTFSADGTKKTGIVQDTSKILKASTVYPILVENPYYPREVSLSNELGRGVWAWTSVIEIKGLKVSENQIDISVRFPVGESHYLVIRGIKPFTRIQLYGMDYRTDNRFETYNSSGYVYNSSTQTLYLKIRHKSETETVRLFYETEQPETSQPADATENASKQQNPENTGEAAPAQVSQGTENLDIPVQIQ